MHVSRVCNPRAIKIAGCVLSPTMPPALRARLSPVVRAIAEAEVAEELGRDQLDDVPLLPETAAVLEHRLLGMPKHFAAGMVALTLLFNRSTRATDGASFTHLSLAKRRKALARIRVLPLGPLKNFTTFYDKMAPFIFWSALEEHHLLHVVLGDGVLGEGVE